MELSEFVEKTIIDITKGVVLAGQKLSKYDVRINPAMNENKFVEDNPKNDGKRSVQFIRFKARIATENEKTSSGKLNVAFASFGAGGGKENNMKDRNETTIEFDVPISLPSSDKIKTFTEPWTLLDLFSIEP